MASNSPHSGDVYQIENTLRNFSQLVMQNEDAFIASGVAPMVPVQKQQGTYYDWNRYDLMRDELKIRAPGTKAVEFGNNVDTATYSCQVYGGATNIADETIANSDPVINPMMNGTRHLLHKARISKERVVLGKLVAASTWTTNMAVGTAWSDSSANPLKDVRDARRTVLELTGFEPNVMILTKPVYDDLANHPNVLSRITGGATPAQPAAFMRGVLTSLMELEAMYVPTGVYTSSAKGAATDSSDFILDGRVALLAYVPPVVGVDSVTAYSLFSWTNLAGMNADGTASVRVFRREENHAWKIEVAQAYGIEIVQKDLGAYLTSL